jgi:DNA polymerase V
MNKIEVGRRHREAREEVLKMSVSAYADLMGVKDVTVYSWESGRTSVPHPVLAKLASVHGISLPWLLTGKPPRTEAPVVLRGARRSDRSRSIRIPMLSLGVSAGVPTVSDDTIEREIDLAEMLLEHPDSTYFIRVVGDSMSDAGISDGDTLIVDCAVTPKPGQVVIAKVYGELTVKRYVLRDGAPVLRAENRRYKDIVITPDMDFAIVGVVRSCIKSF